MGDKAAFLLTLDAAHGSVPHGEVALKEMILTELGQPDEEQLEINLFAIDGYDVEILIDAIETYDRRSAMIDGAEARHRVKRLVDLLKDLRRLS